MAVLRITRRLVIVLCCGAIVLVGVSLLRSGRPVGDADTEVSEAPAPKARVVKVHEPEELLELRDRNTRVYRIVREVEITDPITGEVRIEQVESRIMEKANNLCYRDGLGNFVPSVPEFEAVPGGFVADHNNFSVVLGQTLEQGFNATIDGVPVMMKPAYLMLFDGKRAVTLAKADPRALGQLDVQNLSVVRFPRAFGDLADLEYIVGKGGFHQNVIINKPIDLPPGFEPEDSQLLVYSEIGYDDLVYSWGVRATDVSGEVDLSTLNSASALSEEEILFETSSLEGRWTKLFSFGESEVRDSADDLEDVKRTVAQKQLFRSEVGLTYLVETIDHSFLCWVNSCL